MQSTGANTPKAEISPSPPSSENRLVQWLHRLEDGLLIIALMSMIGMAVLQIVLRTLFHTGIIWADGFVRLLVLWVGLLGAVSASRNDSHIRIDLVSRYLPERWKTGGGVLIKLATAVICAATAWFGARFILVEFHYKSLAFAAVPSWICEIIIPLGFAVIALRYVVLAVNQFKDFFRISS